jgi:hypothetical protein
MIHSSKAIALVLVSSASILLGYHAFDNRLDDDGPDEWGNAPTTRSSSGSHYYGHSHYYYGHSYGGGSGFFSSGSGSFHGTSHGGFGGTGHAGGS